MESEIPGKRELPYEFTELGANTTCLQGKLKTQVSVSTCMYHQKVTMYAFLGLASSPLHTQDLLPHCTHESDSLVPSHSNPHIFIACSKKNWDTASDKNLGIGKAGYEAISQTCFQAHHQLCSLAQRQLVGDDYSLVVWSSW